MRNQATRRAVVLFTACMLAPFTVLGACGGDKPEPKTAPTETVAANTTTAPASSGTDEKINNTPTSSAIHISDEILKACGIDANQAYFAFDSANIDPNQAKPLDLIATCFSTGPLKGKVLQLIGHADPRGDADYNFALGQSRADAVKKYLLGKGMGTDKLQSTSRGAMDASGSDEPSWAKDRRVDLQLGT